MTDSHMKTIWISDPESGFDFSLGCPCHQAGAIRLEIISTDEKARIVRASIVQTPSFRPRDHNTHRGAPDATTVVAPRRIHTLRPGV